MDKKSMITEGKTALGIEFGSTRVKAVLIGEDFMPLASGGYEWENKLEGGYWTYSLDEVHTALKVSFAALKTDVKEKYDCALTKVGAIGISGMMHGYMPFNDNGDLLVPFRTWRNTITGEAATKLSDLFGFNIPQRWSIAHLYRAILIGEEHVKDITYFTTLAGFIHWKLTDEKVLGVGEASGMFPIDDDTRKFNADYIEKFNALDEVKAFPWKLQDILPTVLSAGESEELTMFISMYDLASYDESGKAGYKSAYVIEKGSYGIAIGDNVTVSGGLFEGYTGTVQAISEDMKNVTVLIKRGNRDMPVELTCEEVKLLESQN